MKASAWNGMLLISIYIVSYFGDNYANASPSYKVNASKINQHPLSPYMGDAGRASTN